MPWLAIMMAAAAAVNVAFKVTAPSKLKPEIIPYLRLNLKFILLALACLSLRLLPPAVALGEAHSAVSDSVPQASSGRASDVDPGFKLDSDSVRAGRHSTGKRRNSNHAARLALYMVSSSKSPRIHSWWEQ